MAAGKTRCCLRCGAYYTPTGPSQKYCPDCRLAVRACWSRTYYQKQAADQANREVVTREASLRLLAGAVDWAGISYGRLMAKSPEARAALIRQYQQSKGEKP